MTHKEVTAYKDDTSAAFLTITTVLEIWGTNSTLSEKKVTLEVTEFDLQSDWTERWEKEVVLAPNASTELYKGDVKGQPVRTKKSEVPKDIIVSARLLDADGTVLSRYANWSVPSALSGLGLNYLQARAIQVYQVPSGGGGRAEH